MMKNIPFLCILFIIVSSCSSDEPTPNNPDINGPNDEWSIPSELIFDGGPGIDGIPSVDAPKYTQASDVDFLEDEDLVDVFFHEDDIVAYPHVIMDWHEIINDKLDTKAVAITYCPLTGTSIAWDRTINGQETTFGVSGLLYNTNLMPYDRETGSTWSQIRQDCVNGDLINTKAVQLPILEMNFSALQDAYPQASVVNTDTGIDRDYGRYPYGDYRDNDDRLIFPVTNEDNQLPKKERVLAILGENSTVHIITFDKIEENNNAFTLEVDGQSVLVVGERDRNFMNAFYIDLQDGSEFTYSKANFPDALSNTNGILYDVFGRSNNNDDLIFYPNYIGYYFTFPAFFENVIVE